MKKYLKKFKKKMSTFGRDLKKMDLFLKWIIGISISVAVVRIIGPTWHSDGYVWIPMTEDFFGSIGNNDGRHRPFFGFIAYLIHSLVGEVNAAWKIQNFFAFIAIGITAYYLALRVAGDKRKAFFFAIMPVTSAQIYVWLNHTLINVEGFLIPYLTFWMMADYLQSSKKAQPKKLIIYSLSYGILMLGKAQYNIAGSIIAFGLLIERKRIVEVLKFAFWQSVPVLLWIGSLKVFFGAGYRNYEVQREDYRIWEVWQNKWGSLEKSMNFPLDVFLGEIQIWFYGLGTLVTVSGLLAMGGFLKHRLGQFLLIYFIVTAVFLELVNFHLPRHAGDSAVVAYAGIALFLGEIYKRTQNKKLFWSCYSFGLAIWIWFNMSGWFNSSIGV